MAMITGMRESRGLTEVYTDGYLWLRIRKKHAEKLGLKTGDEIDCDHTIEQLAQIQLADAYESALTILDRASKSSGNLRLMLIRKGYVEPAAEVAVQRLCENGLLNDRAYAERIAKSSLGKPVGIYALKRKLQAKKLSEEEIEAAIDGFDDEQQADACRAAAASLYRRYKEFPAMQARSKLSQALARRGFGWDTISSVLSELEFSNDDF